MPHGTTLLYLRLAAKTSAGTGIFLIPWRCNGRSHRSLWRIIPQSVRGSETIFHLLPRASFHLPKLSVTYL